MFILLSYFFYFFFLQLWCVQLESCITSMEITGQSLLIGNIKSEIHEIFLGSLDELAIQMQRESPFKKNGSPMKGKNLNSRKNGATKSPPKNDANLGHKKEVLEALNSFMPPTRLISTCPMGPIYDVTFPKYFSF